jgi:prepilin-type N-terminal cleavage/methylation domain-containing protein/prepilin-type processing-associated H-X9-DG protein
MTGNSSRAFTLIELYVVMAMIAILISIAYPVYTSILERAKITKDMNNLRQLGLGIQTYLNDNDQVLPATTTWPGTTTAPVLYPKYISSRKVFQSPFDPRPSSESDTAPETVPVSYSINANMYIAATATPPGIDRNMARIVSPASTILIAPNYTGNPVNAVSWAGIATNAPNLPAGGTGETRGTHGNGTRINALFCDSHTESLTFSLTGPPYPAGTFQDTTTDPLGLKHWDPTK